MANSCFTSFLDILLLPHQLSAQFPFPKCTFGKQSRSFQHSWFTQWNFLHDNKADNAVFCHTCVSAFKQGKMMLSNAEPAFVSTSVLSLHVYYVHIAIKLTS